MTMHKMKRPSVSGRRQLGRQTNGHSFASANYTDAYRPKQHRASMHRKALPSPADFYANEIARFTERGDDWAWGCCPFHDDHNPSFCMNLRTGWYQCKSSSCGETGNSIVGFVSALRGLSRADAIRYLGGWA